IGLLLKKGKYKIKVLDLNTLSNSDTFNVFEYMHSELDVDRVLEAVTEATKEVEKTTGDDFWIKAEGLLVRSL
ncbi:type IV secretory system conjugative DNA transfer family protein, partial [Enterococcus faecalis]|nr:type IV secretory system conjugative DNA transfer family protein [Enterococcus faecalis]